MPNAIEARYKSPIRKVLRILERGRETWKAKYNEAKEQIKNLRNRLRYTEKSREEWKKKALELKGEVKRLQASNAQQTVTEKSDLIEKKSLEKKKGKIELTEKVEKHHYSAGIVLLYLRLVLEGTSGLRTASQALSVMNDFFEFPQGVPSWYSGRLWLMRVGYYKLMRPKIQADDWIWIVDFSVQLGKEKSLVVLGVRQSNLPPVGEALRHEDMEPITLEPMKQTNGEIVFQKLEEAVAKTGVPRAIVCDEGSDLKAGVKRFCQTHERTATIYDIKHKVALMLKHRLEKDERWVAFGDYANRLKKQLQQTEYGYLAPPALRTKARYMNLEERLNWAQKALLLLEQEKDKPSPIREKLNGLEAFRQPIEEWGEMLMLATTVEQFVRTKTITCQSSTQLALQFKQHPELKYVENQIFCDELLRFVQTQADQCHSNERLPGSSEVLESLFGKQKCLEGEQAKNGFTGLLLGAAAIVSDLSVNIVKQALESTPVKKVLEWKNEFIGDTLQAKRIRVFSGINAEQK